MGWGINAARRAAGWKLIFLWSRARSARQRRASRAFRRLKRVPFRDSWRLLRSGAKPLPRSIDIHQSRRAATAREVSLSLSLARARRYVR
jgi:hypothetical protein